MSKALLSASALAEKQIKLSFPDLPAFADFPSACRFLGVSRQTGDHWLSANKFPVRTVRLGTRKIGVPLVGLQIWLEGKLTEAGFESANEPLVALNPAQAAIVPAKTAKGRGRPRKVTSA